MGMFDDVTGEMPCQECGRPVSGFQSKDGPCVLAKLTPQELFEEAGFFGATFYSDCPNCKTWNEWTFAPAPAIVVPHRRGDLR